MQKLRTVPNIKSSKVRTGHQPLVMMTAYDTPTARVVDTAGVDIVLVGDSVAMVVLGYDSTRDVTIDDMAHHIGAVSRSKPAALVVGDLPWMSYHISGEETVRNAAKLVRAGAEAVKIEGGTNRIASIEKVLDAEIPVMGHLGLTPQSSLMMGGFRVQATTTELAHRLVEQAKQLEQVGCFALVLEGVPAVVGKVVTDNTSIPVIGIGAGPNTDGQVLVFHDVVGLGPQKLPRFVRIYGSSFEHQVDAIQRFAEDVRTSEYPTADEWYPAPEELTQGLDPDDANQ